MFNQIAFAPVPPPRDTDQPPTMPALAKALGEWLPELAGRCVAATEITITKENIPSTLPCAFVSLVSETAIDSDKASTDTEITEDVMISILYEPKKYPRRDGSESGIWAYYDLTRLRTRILAPAKQWVSPSGGRLRYRGGSVGLNNDGSAVVVELHLSHRFIWCAPDPDGPTPCDPPQSCLLTWCASPAGHLLPTDPPPQPEPEDCQPCP